MSVSHLSSIHKPLDYTQPVNLDLLARVLQTKQLSFDAGVKSEQNQLDNIASLDVAKDSDRQYLNAKLNNLVSTVNNIGGADYSDPNVQNQIGNLGSQIYGDDRVVNAVGNTKKLRYVQSYYKDLREKKPKEYNPANEWYDMNKFSDWLNDGQVGTSARGDAGQVSPYHDYETDWTKIFDKIVNSANVSVEWKDKGLMYMKEGKTYVSPDRVWATASAMLTPQQRQQIAIEARYQYKDVPLSNVTKAYDAKLYNQVGEVANDLADYRAKLKGSISLKDQQDYQKIIAQKEAELTKLTAPIQRGADQMKENLYLNEKLKGLADRYAFTKSTSTLQAATDKMFKAKLEREDLKFDYLQKHNSVRDMIDMADKGLKWDVDIFGNRTIVDDPLSSRGKGKGKNGTLPYDGISTLSGSTEEQRKEFSRQNLNDRKQSALDSNKKLLTDYIKDFSWSKGLPETVVNDLLDNGHLDTKIDPEMEKIVKSKMETWDKMTRGEKVNYDELDPSFKDFASKYQENRKEIEALDEFQNNIEKQVKKSYGLTDDEITKVTRYEALQAQLANLDKKYPYVGDLSGGGNSYTMGTSGGYRTNSVAYESEKKAIENQIKAEALDQTVNSKKLQIYNKNRDSDVDKLIASASVRFNLPAVTVTDDAHKNLAKMISSNATTLEVYDSNGNSKGRTSLNPDDIEVVSKGYEYIKGDNGAEKNPVITFRQKTGSKEGDFDIRKVPLTPDQAEKLGFGSEVQDLTGYRLGLHLNGKSEGISTASGSNYNLKYDIVKEDISDNNNPSVFVRVWKGNLPIIIRSKNKATFPSYEYAMSAMESATKQKTIEDAYRLLDEMRVKLSK